MGATDPLGSSTWHFFRRASETELWCAVPAYRAVPAFLLSGHWRFSGHLTGDARVPPGFDLAAATVADRFNGFYLFQLTAAQGDAAQPQLTSAPIG
jgi:hypothetical protein